MSTHTTGNINGKGKGDIIKNLTNEDSTKPSKESIQYWRNEKNEGGLSGNPQSQWRRDRKRCKNELSENKTNIPSR